MQTVVEKAQAKTIKLSSRNHLRRREMRDHARARMKSVHTMCGTSMPNRMPGMLGSVDIWTCMLVFFLCSM